MKRNYSKPVIVMEEFEANEYIASCYQIACSFGGDNPYSTKDQKSYWGQEEIGSQMTHGGSCTEASRNFVLSDDGTASTGSTIFEMSSDQGKIYGTINRVDNGNTVYWCTYSGDGKRRWNHMGTISQVDPGHPNRS